MAPKKGAKMEAPVDEPNWEVPVKKKKGRRGDVSSDDEKDDGARNKAGDESKRRMTHKEKESERCKHTGKALPKPERHVQRMKGSAKISKERLRSLPGAEAIKKKPELRTKEQMEADTVEREARKAAEAAEELEREQQEAEVEAKQEAEKEAAFSMNKVYIAQPKPRAPQVQAPVAQAAAPDEKAWVCEYTKKRFKSQATWDNHIKSKKYRQLGDKAKAARQAAGHSEPEGLGLGFEVSDRDPTPGVEEGNEVSAVQRGDCNEERPRADNHSEDGAEQSEDESGDESKDEAEAQAAAAKERRRAEAARLALEAEEEARAEEDRKAAAAAARAVAEAKAQAEREQREQAAAQVRAAAEDEAMRIEVAKEKAREQAKAARVEAARDKGRTEAIAREREAEAKAAAAAVAVAAAAQAQLAQAAGSDSDSDWATDSDEEEAQAVLAESEASAAAKAAEALEFLPGQFYISKPKPRPGARRPWGAVTGGPSSSSAAPAAEGTTPPAAAARARFHAADPFLMRVRPKWAAGHEGSAPDGEGTQGATATEAVEAELPPWETVWTECLFDGHHSASLQANADYMRTRFGFTVLEVGKLTLVDTEGLFSYLQENVCRFHTCIQCSREFTSLEACRKHMQDKDHCRANLSVVELAEFFVPTEGPEEEDMAGGGGEEFWHDDIFVNTDNRELVLYNGSRLRHRSTTLSRSFHNQKFRNDRGRLRRRANMSQSSMSLYFARREQAMRTHGVLRRSMAYAKGNSKAIASSYVFKQGFADNAARRAIKHHWGEGGGGAHYTMAGSKQFQKGVRIKGVVSRHSKQGAVNGAKRQQAAANRANRGNKSSACLQ